MAVHFTDTQISGLVQERKPLPDSYASKLELRTKRGHKERELDLQGMNGHRFVVVLRQSLRNVLDFSIILGVYRGQTSDRFRLRRYNGMSHEHTNPIEGETFYGFHIHMATERYQELGMPEETYAVLTDQYTDFHSAMRAMFQECGFEVAGENQLTLAADW